MKFPDFPRLSRDRAFLIRISLVIVGTSVVLAWIVSLAAPTFPRAASPGMAASEDELRIARIRNPALATLGILPADCFDLDPAEVRSVVAPQDETPDSSPVAALHRGLRRGEVAIAITALENLPSDLRHRNEFLGDLFVASDRRDEALSAYRAEWEMFPEASYSSRSITLLLQAAGLEAPLRKHLADPRAARALTIRERLDLRADLRDFGGLLVECVRFDLARLAHFAVVPGLFTGAIWFFILAAFLRLDRRAVTIGLASFLAGAISTVLTLFTVIVQERVQGFTLVATDPPLNQVIYMTAGVGLREETLKLLCFAPLAFVVARRRDDLLALFAAGLAGLGFAVMENIGYIQTNPDTFTAWSRLLSANALHICLTGVAGYWLYRMIVRRGRGWDDFLLNFVIAVVAHGLYNSVIAVPALAEYQIFGIILLALIAYRYLDTLRAHLDTRGIRRRVSPLGVFVLGSVVLACAALVFAAAGQPFRFALGSFFVAVGNLIPLAFVYISRFRDL